MCMPWVWVCPVLLDHAPLCPCCSGGLLGLQSVGGQQGLTLLLLARLDDTCGHLILPQQDSVVQLNMEQAWVHARVHNDTSSLAHLPCPPAPQSP